MLKKMKTNQKGRVAGFKKELLNSLIGLCYIIIVLAIIIGFKLNKWQTVGVLCLISTVLISFDHLRKKKGLKNYISKLLKIYIQIILIIHLLSFLNKFGFWGYMIGVLFMSFFLLFKKRKKFMKGIRDIETAIYGKPLDRENWKPGELKNRSKTKIVWRKKDNGP